MLLAMKRDEEPAECPQETEDTAAAGSEEFVDVVQVQRFLRPRPRPPFPPYGLPHSTPNVEDWFTLWFNNAGDLLRHPSIVIIQLRNVSSNRNTKIFTRCLWFFFSLKILNLRITITFRH